MRERESERESEIDRERESGCAASSNLILNLPSYGDRTRSQVCSCTTGKQSTI